MKQLWDRCRLTTWLLITSHIRIPWLVFKHHRRSRKANFASQSPPDPLALRPAHPPSPDKRASHIT